MHTGGLHFVSSRVYKEVGIWLEVTWVEWGENTQEGESIGSTDSWTRAGASIQRVGRTRKVGDDHCKNQMFLLEAVVLLAWEGCTSRPLIPSGPWIPGFPASASCTAAASPRTPSSAHTLPPHLPDPGNKVLASWKSLPCTAPITVLHAFFFCVFNSSTIELQYYVRFRCTA